MDVLVHQRVCDAAKGSRGSIACAQVSLLSTVTELQQPVASATIVALCTMSANMSQRVMRCSTLHALNLVGLLQKSRQLTFHGFFTCRGGRVERYTLCFADTLQN